MVKFTLHCLRFQLHKEEEEVKEEEELFSGPSGAFIKLLGSAECNKLCEDVTTHSLKPPQHHIAVEPEDLKRAGLAESIAHAGMLQTEVSLTFYFTRANRRRPQSQMWPLTPNIHL